MAGASETGGGTYHHRSIASIHQSVLVGMHELNVDDRMIRGSPASVIVMHSA